MKKLFKTFTPILFGAAMFLISCGEDDPTDTEPADTTYEVTISTKSPSTSESEPGTGFLLELNLPNSNGSELIINYSISGTAEGGSDYESPSSSATIADGESEIFVPIPLIDDTEEEGDETIIITVSSATGYTVSSPSSLTITISDNDSGDGTGTDTCANDNSTNQDNWDCDETPHVSNTYSESVSGSVRTITTNGIPSHDFRNQIPDIVSQLKSSTKTFRMTTSPQVASQSTGIIDANSRPAYDYGVATNGVAIDPAPGEPFIFENTSTGEYNWDWVMEPNNNMEAVGLDCATAHVQPDGTYHYHGDMKEYAEQLLSGVTTGTVPTEPIQIGWSSDGFPILYKYGPDANGALQLLSPSYQLKSGERTGDGVSEPCGDYNGKYTNDYEFVTGVGDLDECNGVANSVTIGNDSYSYFYVITDAFPVIGRCISGTPDNSFKKGGG